MLTYPQFVHCVRQAIPRFSRQWLNDQQDSAVQAPPRPPAFIVAGPGAGKTTVLALRTLKLVLVDGLRPTAVIATTFTRKAAAELKSRILAWGYATITCARAAFGDEPQLQEWLNQLDINGVSVGTLDSLAEQVLADNRPPGGIAPATVEGFLAAAIMRRFGLFPAGRFRDAQLEAFLSTFLPPFPGVGPLPVKLGVALSFADRIRHDQIDEAAFAAIGQGQRVLCDAIADYLQHLSANHLADFGGLEQLLFEALQRNQLSRVTDGLQAILVDEFQDTNYLQERIYFEFCTRSGASLTVVGDDDQSIFRFRGATVEIFANLEHRMASALGQAWAPRRFDLFENYRSSNHIVAFCNRFAQCDPTYQPARVPGKRALLPRAPHATLPHPPVLGLFRPDCPTLANDLAGMLHAVFRGDGYHVNCSAGEAYTIRRAPGGDFGDAVLLARSVREFAQAQTGAAPRQRLPLLLRNNLESRYQIPVFNPRGRNLYDIDPVQVLLGLALLCIDPGAARLQAIQGVSPTARQRMIAWRARAQATVDSDPPPEGLPRFVRDWERRTLPPGSKFQRWPPEWPLLELLFTLVTWIPEFQRYPEGQVYLEAIARTVAEAGQFATLGARILHRTAYDEPSVTQAIREVFENIANGSVEVDEEIMPHIPRNFFPIMTIHQAKGLEFPLAIVDVGSDFRMNHRAQRGMRYPEAPDTVHLIEQMVAPYCPIGPARAQRDPVDRAWDDLRRLYYVAFSRPENVLLLAGLTPQVGPSPRVLSIATGDLRGGLPRALTFVPAAQWHSGLGPGHVALV